MGRLTVLRDLRHDRESNSATRILDMTLKATYLKNKRMRKDVFLLLLFNRSRTDVVSFEVSKRCCPESLFGKTVGNVRIAPYHYLQLDDKIVVLL